MDIYLMLITATAGIAGVTAAGFYIRARHVAARPIPAMPTADRRAEKIKSHADDSWPSS
jgi:hypothetical protein